MNATVLFVCSIGILALALWALWIATTRLEKAHDLRDRLAQIAHEMEKLHMERTR